MVWYGVRRVRTGGRMTALSRLTWKKTVEKLFSKRIFSFMGNLIWAKLFSKQSTFTTLPTRVGRTPPLTEDTELVRVGCERPVIATLVRLGVGVLADAHGCRRWGCGWVLGYIVGDGVGGRVRNGVPSST